MKTAEPDHLISAASHRPTPYRGGMGRLVLPTPLSRDVPWDDLGQCVRRLGLGASEQRYLVPDYARSGWHGRKVQCGCGRHLGWTALWRQCCHVDGEAMCMAALVEARIQSGLGDM